mmetsp:Transcript_9692/g.28877  ORF Transcript_9692/g.28877 Transcript_9692/m.28877 type:complete len:160 (+) Transcript_9692:418-897(+)
MVLATNTSRCRAEQSRTHYITPHHTTSHHITLDHTTLDHTGAPGEARGAATAIVILISESSAGCHSGGTNCRSCPLSRDTRSFQFRRLPTRTTVSAGCPQANDFPTVSIYHDETRLRENEKQKIQYSLFHHHHHNFVHSSNEFMTAAAFYGWNNQTIIG